MLDVGQKRDLRKKLSDDLAQALGISEVAAADRLDQLVSHQQHMTDVNFDVAAETVLTSELPDLIMTLAEGTERVRALNHVKNLRAAAATAAEQAAPKASAEASSDEGTEQLADSLPESPALGATAA